jgi:hypothetical protein
MVIAFVVFNNKVQCMCILYLCQIIPADRFGDKRVDTYEINQLQYTVRRVPTNRVRSTDNSHLGYSAMWSR